MSNRSLISVHTKPETSKRLDGEAIVTSVLRGIADADFGRTASTEEARARIRSVVGTVAK